MLHAKKSWSIERTCSPTAVRLQLMCGPVAADLPSSRCGWNADPMQLIGVFDCTIFFGKALPAEALGERRPRHGQRQSDGPVIPSLGLEGVRHLENCAKKPVLSGAYARRYYRQAGSNDAAASDDWRRGTRATWRSQQCRTCPVGAWQLTITSDLAATGSQENWPVSVLLRAKGNALTGTTRAEGATCAIKPLATASLRSSRELAP